MQRQICGVLMALLGALMVGQTPVRAQVVQLDLYNTGTLVDQAGLPLAGTTNTGDLVQLILTGADNTINPPDQAGNPTGDDTVLFTTHVGVGIPGIADQGLVDAFPISYDSSLSGSNVYVRFWNADAAGTASYYGNSTIFALPAGDPFGQAALDFVPDASFPRQTDIATHLVAGVFNGLVIATNAPANASSGSIRISLSKTGSFTAIFILGGARFTFKGQFDSTGISSNSVPRAGLPALEVVLQLVALPAAQQIAGTASDGTFTSVLLAEQTVFSKANPCPWAGRHTFVLEPADVSDATVPQGYGFGTLMVTAAGKARLTGFLGDGTKMSGNGPVGKFGDWPFFDVLYRNQGSCVAWVMFATNGTLSATVDWFKQPIAGGLRYPTGFTTVLTMTGTAYGSPSVAGTKLVTFGGGNLESNLSQTVLIDAAGKVTVPALSVTRAIAFRN